MEMVQSAYYNQTEAKRDRRAGEDIRGVLVHETAWPDRIPLSDSDTLQLVRGNLGSRASFHDVLGREGTLINFVDPARYVAYHAGTTRATATLPARSPSGLPGGNVYLIGLEVHGPNDGTPWTEKQKDRAAQYLILRSTQYGFPIDEDHIYSHAWLATPFGRKTDPRGCTLAELFRRVRAIKAVQQGLTAYRVVSATANVRAAASTASDVLLTLKQNQLLAIDEARHIGQWHARYPGGFVSGELVTPDPSITIKRVIPNVSDGYASVRRGPGLEYAEILQLPEGTPVFLTGTVSSSGYLKRIQGDWIHTSVLV